MTYKEDRENMFRQQEEWADAVREAIHNLIDFSRFQAQSGDLFAGALSLLRERFGDVIHINAMDYANVKDGSKFSFFITIRPTDDGGCDIMFIPRSDTEDEE